MLKPNDLPLVCLPLDLSDAAAAALIEFLRELTAVLERHYSAQLMRHYHATNIPQHDDDPADAPF